MTFPQHVAVIRYGPFNIKHLHKSVTLWWHCPSLLLSLGWRDNSLSSFEVRHDITRGRLLILGELPLNAHVVYGIAAKHARCMITRPKYAIYSVRHHVKSRSWTESSITMASHKRHNVLRRIPATRCGYPQRVAEFQQRVVVSANPKTAFSFSQCVVILSHRVVELLQRVVGSHNVLTRCRNTLYDSKIASLKT